MVVARGGVEPPTFRFSGRNCLSGEVVQGRIRDQEKGIRPLPSDDSGARFSESVSKLEPGHASSRRLAAGCSATSLCGRPKALSLVIRVHSVAAMGKQTGF